MQSVYCIFTIGGYTLTTLNSNKPPNLESLEIWGSGNSEDFLQWRVIVTVYPDQRRGWSALELDEALSRITSKENDKTEVDCSFGLNTPQYHFTGIVTSSDMSVEQNTLTYKIEGTGTFSLFFKTRLDKIPRFRGKARISNIIRAILDYYDVTSHGYSIDEASITKAGGDDDIRWVDIDVSGLSLAEFLWGQKASTGEQDSGSGRTGLGGGWEGLESMCIKLNKGGNFEEFSESGKLLQDSKVLEQEKIEFSESYDVDEEWRGEEDAVLDPERIVISANINVGDFLITNTETYVGSFWDYVTGSDESITMSASLDAEKMQSLLIGILPDNGTSGFMLKEDFVKQVISTAVMEGTDVSTFGWESSQADLYSTSVGLFVKQVEQQAEEMYDVFIQEASKKLHQEYKTQRIAAYKEDILDLEKQAASKMLEERRDSGATISSYQLVVRYGWEVGTVATFFLKEMSSNSSADLTYGIPGDPRSILSLSVSLSSMVPTQTRIDPTVQGGYSATGELISTVGSKEIGFNGTVTSQIDRINSLLNSQYLSQIYATELKVTINMDGRLYQIADTLSVSINFGGVQHWLSGLYRIMGVGMQIGSTAIIELTLLRIPDANNKTEMGNATRNLTEEQIGDLGIVNSGLVYASAAYGSKEIPTEDWVNIEPTGVVRIDPPSPSQDIWSL